MRLNIIDGVQIENVGPVQLGLNGSNVVAIVPRDTAINIVQRRIFKQIGIFDNSLNIFNVSTDVTDGELNFMSFRPTPYGLRPRKNGCAWVPNLQAVSTTEKIKLHGVEGMLQQCADELFGTTLRRLLGSGVDVYNILSTPESRALFVEAIIAIYGGVIDDITSLTWFGKHPLIATAFNNGTTNVSADELQRAYEMLSNDNDIAGILTIVDKLKADGVPNYTTPINPADVLGSEYIGDAKELFRRVKAAAPGEMKRVISRKASIGKFLVTRSIFDRYKAQLGNLVLESSVLLTKEGAEYLMYDGHIVVPMDEWSELDALTKTNSHRVLFTTEGNFLAGTDVRGLKDARDIGMILEQSSAIKDKGQVFGLTTLDLGFGLADVNYSSYAALTLTA